MNPALAVIIPALNEADELPPLLRGLAAQKAVALEVIVVDGGSSDATIAAARMGGARVLPSARGRARQMNHGARAANAEWLLFLHADSRIDNPQLLAEALLALRENIHGTAHGQVAGHFPLKFRRKQQGHALAWRYLEEKTTLNREHSTSGDQGLLLSRSYFEELGGFDEQLPFLEDQRLCAHIRQTGRLITLPGVLQSSGRRFEQAGFYRQYLLMALIMTMHAIGLDSFFERSPDIYRAQHENGGLRLMPYFRLALRCLRENGWQEYGQHWLRIGRFGCDNAWQLFFFWDVVLRGQLGPGRHPFLDIHDRVVAPLIRNRFAAVPAALTLWLHLHIVILPWTGWQDWKRR